MPVIRMILHFQNLQQLLQLRKVNGHYADCNAHGEIMAHNFVTCLKLNSL